MSIKKDAAMAVVACTVPDVVAIITTTTIRYEGKPVLAGKDSVTLVEGFEIPYKIIDSIGLSSREMLEMYVTNYNEITNTLQVTA